MIENNSERNRWWFYKKFSMRLQFCKNMNTVECLRENGWICHIDANSRPLGNSASSPIGWQPQFLYFSLHPEIGTFAQQISFFLAISQQRSSCFSDLPRGYLVTFGHFQVAFLYLFSIAQWLIAFKSIFQRQSATIWQFPFLFIAALHFCLH